MRLISIFLVTTTLPLFAQWLSYHEAGTPRTLEGKPNLTAPAPRMNGKPDLSGVWQAERTPESEFSRVLGNDFAKLQVDANDITKNVVDVFWGLKPEEQPLRPEAAAIMKQRASLGFPMSRCLPSGIPAGIFIFAFKIVQTPAEAVIVFENGDPPRQIHTDGRSLPKQPQPSWMGYSVGNWEGDALVVQTIGITDQSWIDGAGHPRSESMHITERYHRRDFGHMDLEMTLDDPTYYTKPFTLRTELKLIPDSDVLEYICGENEKDRAHLPRP